MSAFDLYQRTLRPSEEEGKVIEEVIYIRRDRLEPLPQEDVPGDSIEVLDWPEEEDGEVVK